MQTRASAVFYLEEDGSADSNSLSQASNPDLHQVPSVCQTSGGRRSGGSRNSEWEILEGLKDGQRYDKKPDNFSGYLHKKRKWPLKGWHKRYFVLEKGILVYGKSPGDVARGKLHGSVDIGLSVISTKTKRKRLDIDAEEFIYHLKAKQPEVFAEWVEQLKRHRLFRQHLLTYGTREVTTGRSDPSPPPKISLRKPGEGSLSPPLRLQWVLDSSPLQAVTTELSHTQQSLNQLGRILDQIELNTNTLDTESGLTTPSPSPSRPQSLPPPDHVSMTHTSSDNQLCSDFNILARDIYSSLKSVVYSLVTERDRLKAMVEEGTGGASGNSGGVVATLRTALHVALQQNSELRGRLNAIHHQSDMAEVADIEKPVASSLSYSSSCVSEFYDAEDTLDAGGSNAVGPNQASDTSSIAGSVSSEEGSMSSEASELGDSEYNPTQNLDGMGGNGSRLTGRRSKLPVPRPTTEGLSLWNLLTKNIGKDLSQVSMPVALNEPLNMLQRMCEELEYSELLDKASELSDPYERMVYVAAFAVSSYGSSYFRAGSKPFNPLLGETYECIREDKGFRFISEQVSHHPPVSVCFAESRNFVFWEDARIKTKFWGKSMEFQPAGCVNVKLERPDGNGADLYRWNKVTTCVHNLFSGQRWVDQYGELTITSESIRCKLTFVKASYWSAKRHEIYGEVYDEKEGRVVRNLFGKWSEAFYCGVPPSAKCIWRPGTMPEDYELYYGFTRFAMELNELDIDMAKYLPITDTRFRPDQRLLEEGKLDSAEATKLHLEQAQRERRKRFEAEGKIHQPKWFRKTETIDGDEAWEYTHKYWECRKNPGFVNMSLEAIW